MVVVVAVMGLVAGLLLLVVVRGAVWVVGRGKGRWRGVDVGLFALGGVVVVALGYGVFVEPRLVEVTRLSTSSSKWDRGEPVRVVHISDLHSPSNLILQRELPEVIRGLDPDLVVFTGDLANSPEGLSLAQKTLREIAAMAPTYGIRGDVDPDAGDLFAGTGVVELRGLLQPVTVRDRRFGLVGWSRQEDWKKIFGTLSRADKDDFLLFLGHSPDYADEVVRWGADLYLAGHTHGGQVALPFYGALWTASRFGKRFEAGRYRVGEMDLYINRGLGMAKNLPPVRFLARPEVTLHLIEGGREP